MHRNTSIHFPGRRNNFLNFIKLVGTESNYRNMKDYLYTWTVGMCR